MVEHVDRVASASVYIQHVLDQGHARQFSQG